MSRWLLYDPATDETWEFPRSPNKMTSPHPPKNSVIFSRSIGHPTHAGAGISRVLQFRQEPYEWSFSGDIRTQAHYEDFLEWTKKTGRLEITDHFARTWSIRITSIELEEQRETVKNSWKFRYTVRAIMYGPVTP